VMGRTTTYRNLSLCGAVLLLASGCGASAPPRQLVDARAAYAQAEQGPAGTLTPAELVDARKALDAAEASFTDDGSSEQTIDLAYVAERRSQIADARGRTAEQVKTKQEGTAALAELRERKLKRTEQELASTRGEVAEREKKLASQGATLRATDAQLAAERKAREQAEKRAKEAMDKLALAASLTMKEEPRGTVITLPGNVLFATGKWELLPGALSKLDAIVEALKEQPDVTITVEGHTDTQGKPAENLELGRKRAESVRSYLESKGVPKDQLSAIGIGQDRPIGDNKTVEGRAQNRRVEIIIKAREKR
jgi:outer membrane protein OmpA-like peptidoglycan-associated protein